jgi:hypothetical protein
MGPGQRRANLDERARYGPFDLEEAPRDDVLEYVKGTFPATSIMAKRYEVRAEPTNSGIFDEIAASSSLASGAAADDFDQNALDRNAAGIKCPGQVRYLVTLLRISFTRALVIIDQRWHNVAIAGYI